MDMYNGYGNMPGYPQQPYYNGTNTVGALQMSRPYQPPMPQSAPNPNNGIIWIQGEEGAKAYMVAPGNTVQLWDSENPVIYLKSADMSGIPSMRIFDLVERGTPSKPPLAANNTTVGDYVTRGEFNALESKINALIAKEQKPSRTTKTKEDVDNG